MSLRVALQHSASSRALQQLLKLQCSRTGATVAANDDHLAPYYKIGKREVVCYGFSGEFNYADRGDYPMPAVRFKEDTREVELLRQKEKGDWKKLTMEEKKVLYRSSYCQTFAELNAPDGEWKAVLAALIFAFGWAVSWAMLARNYVFKRRLPKSFSPEAMDAQVKYMIAIEANPVFGISSKWDYENKRWKD